MAIPEPNRREKDKECCVLFLMQPGKPKSVICRRNTNNNLMANYYCEYCGHKASSVQSLTSGSCPRHPLGPNKGKHKLYEGDEASRYICEYCGHESASISSLTSGNCPRHPAGPNRGKHKPFEGGLKSRYTCKYCGYSSPNLSSLTSGNCPKHPLGPNKGKHSPAR